MPYVKGIALREDVVMNGNAKLTVKASNSDRILGRW